MPSPTYVERDRRGHQFHRRYPKDVVDVMRAARERRYLGGKTLAFAVAEKQAAVLSREMDGLIALARSLSPEDRAAAAAHPQGLRGWAKMLSNVRTFLVVDGENVQVDERLSDETQALCVLTDMRAKREVAKIDAVLAPAVAHVEPLNDLVEKWIEVRQPRSVKAVEHMRLYTSRLSAHVGKTCPIASIVPAHIISFRDALERDGHSPVNVVKHLEAVRALFSVAVGTSLIRSNPATGIRPTRRVETGTKRGFTGEQIKTILERAKDVGGDFEKITRLLVWTGARSQEICQLRNKDLTTLNGIACIDITPAAGSLKNKASKRVIPMPDACADIVASSSDPDDRLFPSMKDSKHGRGYSYQIAFGKMLREHVTTDESVSLHSLRHAHKTAALEAGVPEGVARVLQGHTRGKDAADGYGEVPMRLKAKWSAVIDPLSL